MYLKLGVENYHHKTLSIQREWTCYAYKEPEGIYICGLTVKKSLWTYATQFLEPLLLVSKVYKTKA